MAGIRPPSSRGCWRTHLRNATPSSPGKDRSVTTRLILCMLAYAFALGMLSASRTIASHARRTSLRNVRLSLSSSTTRMVKPERFKVTRSLYTSLTVPMLGRRTYTPGAIGWGVPYRVDVARASDAVLDRLVELGALDVDRSPGGGIVALMPDGVAPEQVARALGVDDLSISPAVGRDAQSVWILSPRATRIGRLRIVPADA